jgi:hypothetical protein
LAVPADVIDRLDADRTAGVDIAWDLIQEIRASNLFDGVHLIPVARYREMAVRLEQLV